MQGGSSATTFMAEAPTVTLDERAAERTRPAACSMRSVPRRELPPNLKARTLRRCLFTPPAPCARSSNAAGIASAPDSSCAFSGHMACAPLLLFPVHPLERLWRGSQEQTHPPLPFSPAVRSLLSLPY